jgi:sterol carrier protein 2
MIHEPLTKLQCCPTSDGAAAAVLVSQEFLDKRPELKSQAILIAGQRLATDTPSLFNRSAIELVGYSMSELAAREALAEANVSPDDVKVCELHDCFSANEMVTIEALGLAKGQSPRAHPQGWYHVRGQSRHQPVGRPDFKGPPPRRDWYRAVLGARVASARLGEQPLRQGHQGCAAA